ncbi:MAG: hypothetical protein AB7P20_01815 [Rhizobiaceae bacterium]
MTKLATRESGDALPIPPEVVGRLKFAASPTFAVMAGVSAVSSAGMATCAVVSPPMPINEMALMYLLMSLFHLSPWLQFLSRRRAPHRAITQTEGD